MKDFTYSGLWWLPNQPGHIVAGTLSFTIGSLPTLSLLGTLGYGPTSLPTNPMENPELPIMLGVTEQGKAVTLIDCKQTNFHFTMSQSGGGFPTQKLMVGFAYIGAHFNTLEALVFYKAEVTYSHLSPWVGTSGFREGFEAGETGPTLQVRYTPPPAMSFSTSHGDIVFHHKFQSSHETFFDRRIVEEAYALITPNEELNLDGLWQGFVSPLLNMVSLGTQKPNVLRELIVYSRQSIQVQQRHQDSERVPIEVVFASHFPELELGEHPSRSEMLFTLREIADQANVLDAWLGTGRDLDSVVNLFFSTQYHPRMYLEHRFLSIVQSAETYHRRRRKNEVLPKADHRARVKQIVDVAPAAYRDWLSEQLAYGNEPRLRDRLVDLVGMTEPVMLPMIGNVHAFVRKVTDTRNYYTHYDRRLQGKAAREGDLYRLTEKLEILVQACLLNDIGISPTRIADLFQRNDGYRELVDFPELISAPAAKGETPPPAEDSQLPPDESSEPQYVQSNTSSIPTDDAPPDAHPMAHDV